uniref:Uncharacterized protein n=1 Tax=Zea mays TaxID=4577 RepID=A0A804U9T2_MAIZE
MVKLARGSRGAAKEGSADALVRLTEEAHLSVHGGGKKAGPRGRACVVEKHAITKKLILVGEVFRFDLEALTWSVIGRMPFRIKTSLSRY